jgi:RHS repeat-associated protein
MVKKQSRMKLLNQYTSRTVPGFVNVLGTATNTATVSLWRQDNLALYTPTTRKGDYFRGEMLFNNNTGALWLTITNVAVLSNYTGADIVTNTIGKLFVPKTAETFNHNTDGNLTNDGRWAYVWDAENRTTSFTRNSSAPAGSKVKLDCQYDVQWRRTQKIASTWNGSTYVAQSTNKFVYDGWNLIAILDATNGLVQSFNWGLDASGTMQDAGGVGGLISMTIHAGTNAGTYFYCYDGNHNVTTLVNATNGAIEAIYDYDPFLGIIRGTGRLAFLNPFVGSTKFCDWETGFLYYGYRYYDPGTGRWLNRDPIGELGGANLYGFVGNDSINGIDYGGLLTLREVLLSAVNGSYDREFLRIPLGTGFLVLNGSAGGELFECCNKKTQKKEVWFSGSGEVELFYQIGLSTKVPGQKVPGRERNDRVPHPCNPFRTVKKKDLQKAIEECNKRNPPKEHGGSGGFGQSVNVSCPDANGIEGSGKLFLRGKAGIGIGIEVFVEYAINVDSPISLENLSGGFRGGWVGAGASIDAGGSGGVEGVVKVKDLGEKCCGAK